MKKIAIIFIFVLGIVNASFSNDLIQKAEKAYDNKNYKEAISYYQKLINEGNKSYELYFNLGNSYYRNKELGYAIYYYEMARKLDPNDQDVQINLGIAAAKTIDKIDAKENFFINAVRSNVVNVVSTDCWAWFSIALVVVTCILFFTFIHSGIVIVKRISFVFSIIALVAFIAVYLFGSSALNAKKENKFAIILLKEVKITNEPNSGATMKFALHEGTKVRIVEANSDWVLIKLDNGNEGWVKQTEVGII
ncbi:MAG: tetratricopeptide repeat protein [Bacteroidota bacterium]|nr:tetratricopeptide repeat protein [Bacteroidota bacterium]